MTREDTLEGLELCLKGLCDICPYKDSNAPGGCKDELMYDSMILLQAIDVTPEELQRLKMCRAECKIDCLLEHYNKVKDELDAMKKAQEPVEPIYDEDNYIRCGKCKHHIVGFIARDTGNAIPIQKYCGKCGQAVKWE